MVQRCIEEGINPNSQRGHSVPLGEHVNMNMLHWQKSRKNGTWAEKVGMLPMLPDHIKHSRIRISNYEKYPTFTKFIVRMLLDLNLIQFEFDYDGQSHDHKIYCFHYQELNIHGSHKDWKTQKNQKTFSSQGKVRGFYPKYWKNEDILASLFLYFFSEFLIEVYLLNRFLYL